MTEENDVMRTRSALKSVAAVVVVLACLGAVTGPASAGTMTSGQITISGSPGLVIDVPGAPSPCTPPPPAPTVTMSVTSTGFTLTALDSTSLQYVSGVPYLFKISRTASTAGMTNITLTLRVQIYDTAIPNCYQGLLKCTMNLRMGLQGTYTGTVPSPPHPGHMVLTGGTSSTGGIPISAPGCPSPFNGFHGQNADITLPLQVNLP